MYLVRHGETDWNAQRLIQGHSDIPLNIRGREQAKRLAARLKETPITQICSSDLQRAFHTASAVADVLGLQICQHVELRERYYGDWEGKDFRIIHEQYPDFDPWTDTESKYNIETYSDMQQRGIACLTNIIRESSAEHVLVVSHGGLINAMLHHMSNGLHGTGKTKLVNTSLSHVQYQKETWVVHDVNDGTHLDDA